MDEAMIDDYVRNADANAAFVIEEMNRTDEKQSEVKNLLDDVLLPLQTEVTANVFDDFNIDGLAFANELVNDY
eukprot:gene13040-14374_t